MFKYHHKSHYTQTVSAGCYKCSLFKYHHKSHYTQTGVSRLPTLDCLSTIINHTILKRSRMGGNQSYCLSTIINHTILKQAPSAKPIIKGLSTIINHTILKLTNVLFHIFILFKYHHKSHYTQTSN